MMSGMNPDPNLDLNFAEAMAELAKASRALPKPIQTRPLERLRLAARDVVELWRREIEKEQGDDN